MSGAGAGAPARRVTACTRTRLTRHAWRRAYAAVPGRWPRAGAVLRRVNVQPRFSCLKLTAHPYVRICCPRGSTHVVHQRTVNHLNVIDRTPVPAPPGPDGPGQATAWHRRSSQPAKEVRRAPGDG